MVLPYAEAEAVPRPPYTEGHFGHLDTCSLLQNDPTFKLQSLQCRVTLPKKDRCPNVPNVPNVRPYVCGGLLAGERDQASASGRTIGTFAHLSLLTK